MKPSVALALPGALLLAATASAQSFSYPDFSSVANLSLVQQAQQLGTTLRVHDILGTGGANRGAAWYATPVSVSGGFETTFEFQITGPGTGDGMAFVVQNEVLAGDTGGVGVTGIGRHASALGYGLFTGSNPGESLDNSLAIEIDTYFNGAPIGDPSDNHVSIHTGGNGENSQDESFSIGRTANGALPNVNTGNVHTMRIVYVPGTLDVYLDGALALSVPYDFATGGTWVDSATPVGGLDLIGGTSAYVGFTASSGGSLQNHDVLSWTFDSGSAPTFFCTPANPNSSGSAVTLASSDFSGPGVFHLEATGGPSAQFGYFLVSATTNAGVNVSQGVICLATPQGRYNGIGGLSSISQFDGAGILQNISGSSSVGSGFDVPPSLPSPPGGAIVPGSTYHFQLWYRDGPDSNFSDGISVAF